MYNSLNCPNYNTKTLDLMHNNPKFKILLSTDCLCVGFNCKHIQNTVIMGKTKDMDEYVQKSGHPGYDAQIIKDPQGIMYVTKKAVSIAKDLLAGKAPKKNEKGGTEHMDLGIAQFLVLNCLPSQWNLHYSNPLINPQCFCKVCPTHPLCVCPNPCNCSKCTPENLPPITQKHALSGITMAD